MKLSQDVYIVSAVRTPIGKFGGSLASLSAADLGVVAVGAALGRGHLPADQVDEVIVGMARQAGNGPNPARQIAVRSGIPNGVPAYTVNKACGSGLKSIMLGANEIVLGAAHTVVAGGTESMSRVPYFVGNARWGARPGDQELTDGMYRDGFNCPLSGMVMGETAEKLADMNGISRDEQDAYAAESQHRAGRAQASGRFDAEMVPVPLPPVRGETRLLSHDEHVRGEVSPEDLKKLRPVFRNEGSITAGNSSGITDGAAATVLASEEARRRHRLEPIGRIHAYAVAGVDPSIMGIGPVPAVRKLLDDTGMTLEDFGLIELNEAFAAQVLACLRDLPVSRERLNVNGGAIALGHPIGCTGTRIVTTLLAEMHKSDVRWGLATLCISGGMGIAMAIEKV